MHFGCVLDTTKQLSTSILTVLLFHHKKEHQGTASLIN